MFEGADMEYRISDRMEYIIDRDKISDPQYICQILKYEIEPIVNNYLKLNGEIKVRFKRENNKNLFWFEINADRIKPFGYIPN